MFYYFPFDNGMVCTEYFAPPPQTKKLQAQYNVKTQDLNQKCPTSMRVHNFYKNSHQERKSPSLKSDRSYFSCYT